MRALVIGYNAWDVTAVVAGAPPADAKTETPEIVAGGGGPGATAAFALARLGVSVRYAGVLADDPPGLEQARELTDAGVDLGLAVVVPGARSPRAVILLDPDDGTRRILWSRGELRRLRADEVSDDWLDGADLVLCDGHEPEAIAALAPAIASRGLPLVMDAGTPRAESAALAALCTDVVGAEGFAPGLTGRADHLEALRALRDLGPTRVATTLGARGAWALVDSEAVHVPAFDVPVVDTTGAGDAFHAGYAWGRLLGEDLVACLRRGAAVAALKCRRIGGRAGLPTAAEAEATLRDGNARPDEPPRRHG